LLGQVKDKDDSGKTCKLFDEVKDKLEISKNKLMEEVSLFSEVADKIGCDRKQLSGKKAQMLAKLFEQEKNKEQNTEKEQLLEGKEIYLELSPFKSPKKLEETDKKIEKGKKSTRRE